jgi:hypothetical protein
MYHDRVIKARKKEDKLCQVEIEQVRLAMDREQDVRPDFVPVTVCPALPAWEEVAATVANTVQGPAAEVLDMVGVTGFSPPECREEAGDSRDGSVPVSATGRLNPWRQTGTTRERRCRKRRNI